MILAPIFPWVGNRIRGELVIPKIWKSCQQGTIEGAWRKTDEGRNRDLEYELEPKHSEVNIQEKKRRNEERKERGKAQQK